MPIPTIAWPVPLALGIVLGTAVTAVSTPHPSALLVALLTAAVLGGAAVWVVLDHRARRSGLSAAVIALLVATGLTLGSLRGEAWAAQPDPWAARMHTTVEIEGRSDGVVLWTRGEGGLVLRGVGVPEGRVRLLGTLEELAVRRNPGGFDARAHWRRRGARAAFRVEQVVVAPTGVSARAALRRGVVAGLSPAAAGLVQAMTLGIRDELGDLREVFSASGLAHVLALSGLHVGVLAAALNLVARPLARAAPPFVGMGIALYVVLVGASPSVLRAALMVAAVVLAGALRAGSPAVVAALGLAASASLLLAPGWIHDLGFRLSYLSVAGIAVLLPITMGWQRRVPASASARGRWRSGAMRVLGGGVAVSLAAQGATASLVASTFGALPLVSPLVNLIAVPLASLLVPIGFVAGLVGLVGEEPARLVNLVTAPLAEALIALARVAARAPSLPWGEVSPIGHVTYAVAALAAVLGLARRLAPWRALLVVVVAAGVSASTPAPHGTPELVVLDVGQGDAVIIRTGGAQAVLIDGGGSFGAAHDTGTRIVLPALRALGVRALSVVIATHADLDHIQGLVLVIGSIPVGELWIGHREDERAIFRDLVQVAALAGVPVREVRRGESAELGRVRLDVLHPTAERGPVANDDSVVVLVRVDGAPWVLLAGDVSAAIEADLAIPPVPVVLAPHHGSATSTSEALLRAARPRLALVSAGRNRFGHPAASVLERLERHGVAVRTTLEEGALRIPHPPDAPVIRARRAVPRESAALGW
ncbi:DNA internalization-related competence protein ComEC/Rec2 [soil metagenome]